LGFLISVVGNPYSIMAYRINDVFNIQLMLPFAWATKNILFHSTRCPHNCAK
jgi:hypothetical protein